MESSQDRDREDHSQFWRNPAALPGGADRGSKGAAVVTDGTDRELEKPRSAGRLADSLLWSYTGTTEQRKACKGCTRFGRPAVFLVFKQDSRREETVISQSIQCTGLYNMEWDCANEAERVEDYTNQTIWEDLSVCGIECSEAIFSVIWRRNVWRRTADSSWNSDLCADIGI